MQKIFLVEDDLSISASVVNHLKSWGYEAKCAVDYQKITQEFQSFNPHIVLLDIGLPFFNGYHWCLEIRKISKTPIVFISSAADNMNIVMAMNMGGDDFIAKPFDIAVLTAKIQAILRRTYAFPQKANQIEHKGITLHLDDFSVEYERNRIELSKNEFKILQTLLESPGKVISRESIMVLLWEDDSFVDDNTLTVNITRVRKKLEEVGLADFIKTKKRMGYMVE